MKLPKMKFTAAGDMLIQRLISTEYEGFRAVSDYIRKGDAPPFLPSSTNATRSSVFSIIHRFLLVIAALAFVSLAYARHRTLRIPSRKAYLLLFARSYLQVGNIH